MAPFLFPYPTTSHISFTEILHDPTAAYTSSLSDATAARTQLQVALKAAAAGEPGSSALAVLEAVQIYLPYLQAIISSLHADQLLFKGDPVFSWRSALSNDSSQSFQLASIQAESLFVTLTHVISLSNYAKAIVDPLSSLEAAPDAEKQMTASFTRATNLLSEASGVASWSAQNVTPAVEQSRTAGKWPVESGSEIFKGLAMTLLADAHVMAIHKLLLPTLSQYVFRPPGPPLSPNHPSPSLLSKLYFHVATLYTSAQALLKSAHVSSEFLRYLKKEALLSEAMAFKWLGVDAGENGKGARIGEAVVWVRKAIARLGELEDGAVRDKVKSLGIGKAHDRRAEARKARQGRVAKELADMEAWDQAYTKMNDSVSFQPLPPASSLIPPPGRPIFSAKEFHPPPSKWGTDKEQQQQQRVEKTNYW